MEKQENFQSVAVCGRRQRSEGYSRLFARFRLQEKMSRGRLYVAVIFAIVAIVSICALLMARAGSKGHLSDEDILLKFASHHRGIPKVIRCGGKTTWELGYDVEFMRGEELFVIAELFQQGKPVRLLSRKVLTAPTDPGKLHLSFTRDFKDADKTIIAHSAKLQLNDQVLEIPEFTVDMGGDLNGESVYCFRGRELRKLQQPGTRNNYATLSRLFSYRSVDRKVERDIWVPSLCVCSRTNHCVVLNMIPLSRLEYLVVEPVAGCQGLDGEIIAQNLTYEQAEAIAGRYKMSLMAPTHTDGFLLLSDR